MPRKRIIASAGAVIGIGVLLLITLPKPNVPQPWGGIQYVEFTTNGGTRQAAYMFTSYFRWPVHNGTAVEIKTTNGWLQSSVRELSFSSEAKPLRFRETYSFVVDVPKTAGAWRVIVRSAKATVTNFDRWRLRLSGWLLLQGFDSIAVQISTEDTAEYYLPGIEVVN